MSDLNPCVTEYPLQFEQKRFSNESVTIAGEPHSTIVVYHDRITVIDFGQNVTIERKNKNNSFQAYRVAKAMPLVEMEGQLESSEPAYNFSFKGHMLVRITDPVHYITDIKDPLKILRSRVGSVMKNIASRSPINEYRDLGGRLEKAILKTDFSALYLTITDVTITVTLGDEEKKYFNDLKRIGQEQAIAAASGSNSAVVFEQLANLLDLLKSLQIHIGDLNLQDDLVQAVEGKIHDLLNIGTGKLGGTIRNPGGIIVEKPQNVLSDGKKNLAGSSDDFTDHPAQPANDSNFDNPDRPF